MNFIASTLIPILEKSLLNASGDVISYLMKNAAIVGEQFINHVQQKMDEEQKDNKDE